MISFLSGQVELKGERLVIINVGNVGYRVFASTETLKKIPEKGGNVKVWTHQYVREDALELYGFLHLAELELFEILIKVPGIGPKTALGVMSVAPIDTLRKAIASGDTSYLTKVSGIGRKTAEKIIIELREKMAGRGVLVEAPELKEEADALEALVSLGYSQREAREALQQIPQEVSSVEKRVKEALKKLSRAQ
ncbi:MAG: Holliday junction branch migration protein RuvA [Candidatus Sungiibacteriota bacterium]|uniref:Holliday junction branch migration complex subunit RuvA n=1 Tax=Candidatus Sungiibacteriota bacterium TaxID=2750080 RepID=A0A7T5RIU7_9BACT|nr:MAG: Holliday junction branch migration protein RuvA [Candidatus Sungbacteria bacterium]